MKLFQILCSSGVLIILIVILRMFAIRHFPERMFVLLWKIVMLRLMIPFSVPVLRFPGKQQIVQRSINQVTGNVERIGSYFPLNGLYIIWALGSVLFLGIFLVRYYKGHQILSEALPLAGMKSCDITVIQKITGKKINVAVSDRIPGPLTFGIIKPGIVLPKSMNQENSAFMRHVLMHESVHIARCDNMWKILSVFVFCIYWFNPLVWIMCRYFSRDLELSCDEKVMFLLGESQKSDYAFSLLKMAESNSGLYDLYNAFSRSQTEERIKGIMTYRKFKLASIVAACGICVSALIVFAAPQSDEAASSLPVIIEETGGQSANLPKESIEEFIESEDEAPMQEETAGDVVDEEIAPTEINRDEIWYASPEITDEEIAEAEALHAENRRIEAEYLAALALHEKNQRIIEEYESQN